MDLPATPTAQPRVQVGEPNAIQLVSGVEAIKGPVSNGAGLAASAGSAHQTLYSYDPGYHQLRGRLEYSEANHCWKLRYIPVDGVTDDFGGSVILANTSALSGYERGDFVEVQGELKSADPKKQGYAPQFEIRQIKRVRN